MICTITNQLLLLMILHRAQKEKIIYHKKWKKKTIEYLSCAAMIQCRVEETINWHQMSEIKKNIWTIEEIQQSSWLILFIWKEKNSTSGDISYKRIGDVNNRNPELRRCDLCASNRLQHRTAAKDYYQNKSRRRRRMPKRKRKKKRKRKTKLHILARPAMTAD